MAEYNPEKQSNVRLLLVYLLLVVFGLVCFTQIMVLGIKYRPLFMGTSERCLDKTNPDWKNSPLAKDSTCNCFLLENEQIPRRGDIYDDRGRVLAGAIRRYDLALDGTSFKNTHCKVKKSETGKLTSWLKNIGDDNSSKDNSNAYFIAEGDTFKPTAKLDILIDSLAIELHHIFKHKFPYDKEYYKTRISKAYKEFKNITILRSDERNDKLWITEEDKESISEIPFFKENNRFLTGLDLSSSSARINPYGDLARRAIGRRTGNNWDGIEYEMNSFLHGVNGAKQKVNVSGIDIPLNNAIMPVDGQNVHTTINLEMQNIVHAELMSILKEYRADWGCAILMETKTGEVKAVSNLTASKDKESYSEEQNYITNFMLEPGSTFKLASLLAYLERTENDSAKQYPILAHTFTLTGKNGKEYRFPKFDEPGKIESKGYAIDAFQRSSNVGIASMIFDKYNGYTDFLSKIDSMFITTSFSTQLGKVQPPNINRKAKDFHSYYNSCFGTGFKMSPMQSLIYFNAVANDGKMIVPLFVKSITDGKKVVKEYEAEVISEQICKPTTIARAKEYLRAVVEGEHGTAKRYKSNNYTFAGKTGTRDIWDETTGGYNKALNCVSFCGYFPADTPKYTCVIYIYNVPKKSSIAVGTFTNIAQNILNLTHYDALKTVDMSKDKVYPHANIAPASQLNVIYQSMGLSEGVGNVNVPYLKSTVEKGKPAFKAYELAFKDNVPNVVGMPAANAVYELNKAGYKVIVEGKGAVKRQSTPGKEKTVVISLGP